MPSKNKKPQVSDLSALLKGLNEAGIEFILVGGMAAVAQGAPVTTFDLDIVHRQTDENIEKLMKFLKSVDVYQRRPDDKVIEPNERDLKGKGHVLQTDNTDTKNALLMLLIAQDRLSGRKPGNRHAERRTTYIIKPDAVTEDDRARFSAMLSTDPQLNIFSYAPTSFHGNLH